MVYLYYLIFKIKDIGHHTCKSEGGAEFVLIDEVSQMKFEGPTVEEYLYAAGLRNSSGEII